jgi:hypothetical protein
MDEEAPAEASSIVTPHCDALREEPVNCGDIVVLSLRRRREGALCHGTTLLPSTQSEPQNAIP